MSTAILLPKMLHGNRCVTFFMIVINRLFISNCNFIKYIAFFS